MLEPSGRSAETPTATSAETLDDLAADLQRLRASAGHVAYGEIAARIAGRREAEGMSAAAAQVGRSSVYDVFRAGRTRTNPNLVAEIVRALGEDDDAADEWRVRCLRARDAQTPTLARKSRVRRESLALEPSTVRAAMVVLLLLSCVGLNVFGNSAAGRIPVTLYLDMIGTAIAAMVLGPWYGVAVGAATSSLAAISNVPGSIAFILVEVVGALVWGYGVRAWRLGRSPLRLVLLNAIAGLTCTIMAVPVIVVVFDGVTDHPADALTKAFEAFGNGQWTAVFSSNILTSLADKQLSGVIAVVVFAFISSRVGLQYFTADPPQVWLPRRFTSTASMR